MKKVVVGLVVVVVLVVAALFVAPPMLGNSLVKSRIIAGVKESTGRDLQISDVSLALLPTIEVSLSDLRLANAADRIQSLLIITKLITVFKHYDSVDEAAKSYEADPVG